MKWAELTIPPGIRTGESEYSDSGRVLSMKNLRFFKGKLEKRGGWMKLNENTHKGIVRGMRNWTSLNQVDLLAYGTQNHLKVTRLNDSLEKDITPIYFDSTNLGKSGNASYYSQRQTLPATGGYSVANLDKIVNGQLHFSARVGRSNDNFSDGRPVEVIYRLPPHPGRNVVFNGLMKDVAEIDLQADARYKIVWFKIDSDETNSMEDVSSFAAMRLKVFLPKGNIDQIGVAGYGSGEYGTGPYGSGRKVEDVDRDFPRIWSISDYGEDILFCAPGTQLYRWSIDEINSDVSVSNNIFPNSPVGNFLFVTAERYPVLLGRNEKNVYRPHAIRGANTMIFGPMRRLKDPDNPNVQDSYEDIPADELIDDPMYISWPDQNDIHDWVPSEENTANYRRLQEGNYLLAGAALANRISVIWSDTSCFRMLYRGDASGIIYSTEPIAVENSGIIGPMAFCVNEGYAYWMGRNNFYVTNGSQVREMFNQDDVREYVFENINQEQAFKSWAYFDKYYNEVLFVYPGRAEDGTALSECSDFVCFHMDTQTWSIGKMNRSSGCDRDIQSNLPVFASNLRGSGNLTVNRLYQHEFSKNNQKLLNADGGALPWSFRLGRGGVRDMERMTDVLSFQPDFETIEGCVDVKVKGYEYAASKKACCESVVKVEKDTERVDLRMFARLLSVEMGCEGLDCDVRLGRCSFGVKTTARRK